LRNIRRRCKYRSYKEDWGRKEIRTEGHGQERTGKEETKQPGEKIEIYAAEIKININKCIKISSKGTKQEELWWAWLLVHVELTVLDLCNG